MNSLKVVKIEISTKRNPVQIPPRRFPITKAIYTEKSKKKATCDVGKDINLKRVVLVVLEGKPEIWKHAARAEYSAWESVGIEVYERTEQIVSVLSLRRVFTLCKSSVKRKLRISILNQNLDTVQTETAMWSLPYYGEFKYYRETLKNFENKLRDRVFNEKFPPATDDEIQFIGFGSLEECEDSDDENYEGVPRHAEEETEMDSSNDFEVGEQSQEHQYQDDGVVNYYAQSYREHGMMEEVVNDQPVVGRYEEIGGSLDAEQDQHHGYEMEEVVNDISVVGRYEEIDGSLNDEQQNQHQRYEYAEALYHQDQPGPSSRAMPVDHDALAIRNCMIQLFVNHPDRFEFHKGGIQKILDYLEKEEYPDAVKTFGDLKYMEEMLEAEKKEQEEKEIEEKAKAVKAEGHKEEAKESKELIPKL
ncbi:hypothetical protein GCK72_006763 [Caenorhabditis remanei]|uniref:Uncharacterized protein n=1 Tax=Caenorhabditis remanei TaxID=31234 RepID=A0A6A5HH49_CAERE|nr:hypothetical protein GCK72_006763 [Caenorhabditis remanei]KAF1766805.1 hypothetical protein GCK72_006763 [Caenorhabditis remanei]